MSETHDISAEAVVRIVGGEPRVCTVDVAERTGNEHRAVLQLLDAHADDFRVLGGVAFEMQTFDTHGGPQQRRVAQLNEQQATLLITYMRNSDIVRAFKLELVKQFYAMREHLAAPKSLQERSLEIMGELVAEVARHTATIAELEPRAGAWDEIASASGDHAVADAAKMLQRAGIETGRDRLFDSMHAFGWVYRAQGRWQAKQSAVDAGYLRHKPQSHNHPETGQRVIDPPQVRVTMKGIERLRVRLQQPVAELAAT